METNKVPTAEQFFKTDYKGDIVEFAKEFAKLHVKAALETAAKNGKETWDWTTEECNSIIEDAYPENLIK